MVDSDTSISTEPSSPDYPDSLSSVSSASTANSIDHIDLESINSALAPLDAVQRMRWMLAQLPTQQVLTSSFGIQSAVMLHLCTQLRPDLPVLVVDTGYLFPETYRFIETLQKRLDLHLHVIQPDTSPSWFEATQGELWEQGKEGLQSYNQMRKVQPMENALSAMKVQTWYSGVRRQQSSTRANLAFVEIKKQRYKCHPILDWTNRDVHNYLKQHDLPYHPLWEAGYVSVGDTHSSQPLTAGMTESETRFNGLQRECGLHV